MKHRMKRNHPRPINTALALLATGLLGATANATSNPLSDTEAVTETVRYDDLDVNSSAGKEVLLKRINRAATRVCRSTHQGPSGLPLYHRCKRETLDDALAQVERNDARLERLRASH
jgi:UrcA family protein